MKIIVPDNPLFSMTNVPQWWERLQREKCDPIHLFEIDGIFQPLDYKSLRDFCLGGELESLLGKPTIEEEVTAE
ncbi:MAG: hypothetical protein F6K54_16165 [Okeania sp. SIO3B5]|uniref:hypothetical protein n=1 Tax=Okeania sp. SIO3B5 TaxID=2607811 RepID=UPI00140118F2|nr:hypothetical protein [Okeania sp. SIO3B5]NEO54479.1 hypothetical protein [Okeania sp. SIO3B5]